MTADTTQDTLRERSNAIDENSMRENYLVTNRWFTGLFIFQWLGGIVAALLLSPLTWQGPHWSLHPHVWQAVLLGGITAAVPVLNDPPVSDKRRDQACCRPFTNARFRFADSHHRWANRDTFPYIWVAGVSVLLQGLAHTDYCWSRDHNRPFGERTVFP